MFAHTDVAALRICEVNAKSSSFGYFFVSAYTRVQSSTAFCHTTKSLYDPVFFCGPFSVRCSLFTVPILFAIHCSLASGYAGGSRYGSSCTFFRSVLASPGLYTDESGARTAFSVGGVGGGVAGITELVACSEFATGCWLPATGLDSSC